MSPLFIEESLGRCVCGARAVYRLTRGGLTRYRCAACAKSYPSPAWEADLLPAFQRHEELDIYQHYCELRDRLPDLEPDLLGTLERFRGRVAELEARYQRGRQVRQRRSA